MSLEDKFKIITLPVGGKTVDCSDIIRWAEAWDWGVGKTVAKRLANLVFTDWETMFALTVNKQYAGACILEKRDGWGTDVNPEFTPFITAVYIEPKFRGKRLSGKLLNAASVFARSLGFDTVYLISGEQGFYEKFGFEICGSTITLSNTVEPVYKKYIG